MTSKTKASAASENASIEKEAVQGTPLAPILERFFKVWLRKYRAASSHTERSYMQSFKSLLTYMWKVHGIRPRALTVEDLTEKRILGYIDWLKAGGCKESTCNTRIGALKSLASYIEHQHVDNVEFCKIVGRIRPYRNRNEAVKFLEREAIGALFAAAAECGLREQAVMEVLYDSGARASELVGIRTGDVTFPKGEKRANVTLYGKGRKQRTVQIGKQATACLKLYMKQYSPEPDGPLFFGREGRALSPSGLAYIVTKCEKIAKAKRPEIFPFKVHPHTLRHSVATHMVRAGVSLETVRLFLGHSSYATTMIYAQVDPRTVSAAVELVHDNLVGKVGRTKTEKDELDAWLASLFVSKPKSQA